jgi:hypothetical protein
MRVLAFALGGILAVSTAAFTIACATPNIPDDALGDGENATEPPAKTGTSKRDAGRSTPPDDTTTSDASAPPQNTPPATQADGAAPPPPPPATTNACATSTTQGACYGCCETQVPSGVPFLNNEWGKCVCEVPGACANACANSYCAGQPVAAGSACDSCLAANNQTCVMQADNKCAADVTCKKLFQCDTDSKCSSKAP